jgi:hypothetical protein
LLCDEWSLIGFIDNFFYIIMERRVHDIVITLFVDLRIVLDLITCVYLNRIDLLVDFSLNAVFADLILIALFFNYI